MEETLKFKFLMSRNDGRKNCREMRRCVGQLIHEYRCKQGLTLLDMSDALHLPVMLLDEIEAGYGCVKIEHILYICRFLGLNIQVFLSPHDEKACEIRDSELETTTLFRIAEKNRIEREGGDIYVK